MADLYEIDLYQSDNPDEQDSIMHLSIEAKLRMSERANEIYRQQLHYMQDHAASLRSLIQDEENRLENLELRYDLGLINKVDIEGIDDADKLAALFKKSWYLSKQTILENFELREMVNELRDENYHLRKEIETLAPSGGDDVDSEATSGPPPKEMAEKEANDEEAENKEEGVPALKRKIKALEQDMLALRQQVQNLSLPDILQQSASRSERETGMIMAKHEQVDNEDTEYFPLHLEFKLDALNQLNLEKEKGKLLIAEMEQLSAEVAQLRKLKMNLNLIRRLFGRSLRWLIPFGLSELTLSRYTILFDGYYRAVCSMSHSENEMIPADVARLIGCYFPIFWELK